MLTRLSLLLSVTSIFLLIWFQSDFNAKQSSIELRHNLFRNYLSFFWGSSARSLKKFNIAALKEQAHSFTLSGKFCSLNVFNGFIYNIGKNKLIRFTSADVKAGESEIEGNYMLANGSVIINFVNDKKEDDSIEKKNSEKDVKRIKDRRMMEFAILDIKKTPDGGYSILEFGDKYNWYSKENCLIWGKSKNKL